MADVTTTGGAESADGQRGKYCRKIGSDWFFENAQNPTGGAKSADDAGEISADFIAAAEQFAALADEISPPQIPYESFALAAPIAPAPGAPDAQLAELSGVLHHSLYELLSCLIAGEVFDAIYELSRATTLAIFAERLADENGALEPGAWAFESHFGGACVREIFPPAAASARDIFAFGEAVLAAAEALELQIAAQINAAAEGANVGAAGVLGACDALTQLEGAAAAAEQAAEILQPVFCLREAAADAEQLGATAAAAREKIAEKLALIEQNLAELAAEQIAPPSEAGGQNAWVAAGFEAGGAEVCATLRGFGNALARAQLPSAQAAELLK